jgi:coproporphyrinogen III oxidase-like Fe-S oxidoreductase
LQLAGKEHLAVLLGNLNLVTGQKDDKGYAPMSTLFVVSGTPSHPDSSQLWKIVGSVAAAVPGAAKALDGLFGR